MGVQHKTLMLFRVYFFLSGSVSHDHSPDLAIDFTCNCLTLKYLAPILNY